MFLPVFCGSAKSSLSGSVSSALQGAVLVFIGKRLTCGFLFSSSAAFHAYSFLSVVQHVSYSIFSILALNWMSHKQVT